MSFRYFLLFIPLLLMLTAAKPVSPGYPAYEQANTLFVERKFPEALAATDEALRLDPNLVPALTLKAKLAMATNRFDVARQSLEHALSINPRAEYAQFLYGLEAYVRNDLQAALPRFRKAWQLNPADARANLYLGLSSEGLGQSAEALRFYKEAVRIERVAGTPQADTLLPYARLLLLLDRPAEAETAVRDALQAAPDLRDAHFELARLLLRKGDSGHAAEEGEIALALSQGVVTDVQIHYLLIRAWQQNGMPDRSALHAGALRAIETPVQR